MRVRQRPLLLGRAPRSRSATCCRAAPARALRVRHPGARRIRRQDALVAGRQPCPLPGQVDEFARRWRRRSCWPPRAPWCPSRSRGRLGTRPHRRARPGEGERRVGAGDGRRAPATSCSHRRAPSARRAATVRTGGRSCAVAGGTPLAALAELHLAGGPAFAVRDYGHCSASPRDSGQLFVYSLDGETNRGQNGWEYKVNSRRARPAPATRRERRATGGCSRPAIAGAVVLVPGLRRRLPAQLESPPPGSGPAAASCACA